MPLDWIGFDYIFFSLSLSNVCGTHCNIENVKIAIYLANYHLYFIHMKIIVVPKSSICFTAPQLHLRREVK
jgi:hypothetical protein